MSRPRVIITFECPPLPTRQYDWSAVEPGYEPGDAIGYGATEDEAIADLSKKLFEAEAERDTRAAIEVGRQQRTMFAGIFSHIMGDA